jgi:hypothetical protein
MVHPQFADGEEGLQVLRVAANILNTQSRTVYKEWSSRFCAG